MKKIKIVEVGPYPPPNTGWSVRIKQLRDAFDADETCDCNVLKLGKLKAIKSPEYIDVQGGFDYIKKLFLLRVQGYHFHMHANANAEKGPLLVLIGLLVSLIRFKRAVLTFHGGLKQIYFPKENGGKMYWLIYLNFLLAGVIICNDEDIKSAIADYGPGVEQDKIYPIPAFSTQYMHFQKKSLPEKAEKFIAQKKFVIISYVALREGYFLDVVLDFLNNLNPQIGVIFTGIDEVEDDSVAFYYQQFLRLEQKGAICIVNNLDHDQFMTLLNRSHIFFRPSFDGVSSSVLEALSTKTPVVASENGRRPEGVITYKADDPKDLLKKISFVLANYEQEVKKIIPPKIRDTVSVEVEVIKRYFTH